MSSSAVGVKICGLADAAGFDAAVRHGADWLGFVFFAASSRAVDPARAAELSARHPGGPGRIGLFVQASDDAIGRCLDRVRLDGLQLYDTAERACAIGARFGLPVWLACAVSVAADLPGHVPGVDRLLVEARAPPQAGRPGGNGTALDWSLLRDWQAPLPWLLAGGLDAGNGGRASACSGAAAVDGASGGESSPGVKDPARVAAFIHAAKAAGAKRSVA